MNLFNKILTTVNNKISEMEPITTSPAKTLQLNQISAQLYHSKFPQDFGQVKLLNKYFNKNKQDKYRIQVWNLSQYQYDKGWEKMLKQNPALNHIELFQLNYQFYSTLPITTVILTVQKIEKFLISDANNIAVVHCQSNMMRSILFFVSYFCLTNKVNDAAEGINLVLNRINVGKKGFTQGEMQEKIFGSQHHILRDIINYHKDNNCINKNHLKLQKLIINPYPLIKQIPFPRPSNTNLKVILDIRKQNSLIYRKSSQHPLQSLNEFLKFSFIEASKDVIIHDDCLFTVKYVYKQKVYPAMRVQLNSNFLYGNFCRIPMKQLDIIHSPVNNNGEERYIFADIFFQQVQGTMSKLSMMQEEGISSGVNYQKILESIKNEAQNFNQQKEQALTQKQQAKNIINEEDLATPYQEENMFDINDHQLQIGDEDEAEKHLNNMLTKLKIKQKIKQQQNQKLKKEEEEALQLERQLIQQQLRRDKQNQNQQKKSDLPQSQLLREQQIEKPEEKNQEKIINQQRLNAQENIFDQKTQQILQKNGNELQEDVSEISEIKNKQENIEQIQSQSFSNNLPQNIQKNQQKIQQKQHEDEKVDSDINSEEEQVDMELDDYLTRLEEKAGE